MSHDDVIFDLQEKVCIEHLYGVGVAYWELKQPGI